MYFSPDVLYNQIERRFEVSTARASRQQGEAALFREHLKRLEHVLQIALKDSRDCGI